jgi:hypothetical protein
VLPSRGVREVSKGRNIAHTYSHIGYSCNTPITASINQLIMCYKYNLNYHLDISILACPYDISPQGRGGHESYDVAHIEAIGWHIFTGFVVVFGEAREVGLTTEIRSLKRIYEGSSSYPSHCTYRSSHRTLGNHMELRVYQRSKCAPSRLWHAHGVLGVHGTCPNYCTVQGSSYGSHQSTSFVTCGDSLKPALYEMDFKPWIVARQTTLSSQFRCGGS